jgi:hypothetical protein
MSPFFSCRWLDLLFSFWLFVLDFLLWWFGPWMLKVHAYMTVCVLIFVCKFILLIMASSVANNWYPMVVDI